MNEIFNYLKRNGILKKNQPNIRNILKLSPKKIFDITKHLVEIGRKATYSPRPSQFTHFASMHLGGGKEACSNPTCRIERTDSLARFALMYSDKVFIHNYFIDYDRFLNKGKTLNPEIINNFIADISVLSHLSPLIESNKISIFTPEKHICPFCLAKMHFGKSAAQRMDSSIRSLSRDYLKNTKVNLQFSNGHYGLHCTGPELFFEHGGGYVDFCKLPPLLANNKKILKLAERYKSIPINQRTVKKLGFLEGMHVRDTVRNICYEIMASKALGTSFLTNRELDVRFLEGLTKKSDISDNNKLALQYLTSEVPFLNNVNLKDLIKLREKEEASFVLFRHALIQTISEFKAKRGSLTAQDAKEIYSDVLQPRLAKLDRTVKSAMQSLRVKPLRSVIAAAGVISFGAFMGFLSTEVKPIIQALGASVGGVNFIKNLLSIGDTEDAIKTDSMYFLWRVKKLSRKCR